MSNNKKFRIRKPLYLQSDVLDIEKGVIVDVDMEGLKNSNWILVIPEGVTYSTSLSFKTEITAAVEELHLPSTFVDFRILSQKQWPKLRTLDLSKTLIEVLPNFRTMPNLKKLLLPDTVIEIPKDFLDGNREMTKLYIPSTVKRIGKIGSTLLLDTIVTDNPEVLIEKLEVNNKRLVNSYVDVVKGAL